MKHLPLFLLLAAPVAMAEVTAKSPAGFVSEHTLILAAPPKEAMTRFAEDVHLWWDASHSFAGSAAAFSMTLKAGGCFCETSADGVSVEHLRVVNVQPGRSVTFHGGLGPLQSMAVSGVMLFQFLPHEEGTQLKYRYAVGGYHPDGLEFLAGPVDQVQLGQLQRLQHYLQTNKPLNE